MTHYHVPQNGHFSLNVRLLSRLVFTNDPCFLWKINFKSKINALSKRKNIKHFCCEVHVGRQKQKKNLVCKLVFLLPRKFGSRSFQFYRQVTTGLNLLNFMQRCLCHAYFTSFCMTSHNVTTTMPDCGPDCRICQLACQFSINRMDEDLF